MRLSRRGTDLKYLWVWMYLPCTTPREPFTTHCLMTGSRCSSTLTVNAHFGHGISVRQGALHPFLFLLDHPRAHAQPSQNAGLGKCAVRNVRCPSRTPYRSFRVHSDSRRRRSSWCMPTQTQRPCGRVLEDMRGRKVGVFSIKRFGGEEPLRASIDGWYLRHET